MDGPYLPSYDTDFDPTLLPTDFFDYSSFPPAFPSILPENTQQEMRTRIDALEQKYDSLTSELHSHSASLGQLNSVLKRVDWLESTVKYLKTYLIKLSEWATDVTGAVDKVTVAPRAPAELEV